jgi:protein crumbs
MFEGVGVGDGVGVGLALLEGVGFGEGVGVGLGVFGGVGVGEGVGVGLGVLEGVGRGFGDSDLGDKGVGLDDGAPGVGRRNLSSFTGVGLGDTALVGFVINVVFSSGATFSSTGGMTGED